MSAALRYCEMRRAKRSAGAELNVRSNADRSLYSSQSD
jgi:hypothetical protein